MLLKTFRARVGASALALGLAMAVASCATPTPYAPTNAQGYGFREQRIENDRYVVAFSGNSATPAELVADSALRRAADLTLSQGFDWFEVVSRSDDISRSRGGGSGLSVGVGGVSGGGDSAFGTSVGMSFPLGGGSGGSPTTSLEIRMGRGERPDRPTVYDARDVSNNLAAAAAAAAP
jgi:hypothetical protein